MAFTFEPMSQAHGQAVIDIFNHYVTNSFAAYPEKPVPPEFFGRLLMATEGYPAFVALTEAGKVAGFGFLRPFHPASSLHRTAEVTYFISPEMTKQGIGVALLNRLIEHAGPLGIDLIVANISSKNTASIAFHQKNGFRECGRFDRAGRKNGEDFDVVWMQRHLSLNWERYNGRSRTSETTAIDGRDDSARSGSNAKMAAIRPASAGRSVGI